MVLQFLKTCFIRGDYFRVLPLAYFISWFSVEILLLMVHGNKLNEQEVFQAESMLLLSAAPTEINRPIRRKTRDPTSQVFDPSPADIELQSRTKAVASQSESLLQQYLGPEQLPRHRAYFRGDRVGLKALGGDLSTFLM
jgi:hypothetical protein